MSVRTYGYTAVQHSAYGYKEDPRFEHGLQPAMLDNAKQEVRVREVGGVVFDSYKEASDFCDTAMYPANVEGLIPRAQGKFSAFKVDGLKVYIPVRVVVG